ncbi:MAG: peptidylprolyl isomerase [Devosia sp.]|nr:peptidylprolyl isomerase [Devosia sp.]
MNARTKSSMRRRVATLGGALVVGTALIWSPATTVWAQDAGTTTAAPAAGAAAQPAPIDPKTVLATVGDHNITEADLEIAGSEMQQQMQQQQVPQPMARAYVLEALINLALVSNAARDAKVDQSADYQQLKSYFDDRALQRVFLSQQIAPQITSDTLKAAYNDYVKAFQPQDEIHARHILVKTEAEAKDIEQQLAAGAKFEDLAKAKSTDTGSAANGGDLGFFGKGQMVKQFEDAAFALKVGAVSAPVQSQFGWHIIRVDETRKTQPAPFEQMTQQLQQQLFTKAFDAIIVGAKAKAAVTVKDSGLDAQIKSMLGPNGASGQ